MLIGTKNGKYVGYAAPETQLETIKLWIREKKIDSYVSAETVPELGAEVKDKKYRPYAK
ncbi:hypothetical protein AGMMS50212_17310 [Spirochaetia bacterium]|nr:hypothetical protein AGMMS50212_17310 [Spirochaetia bacterium]